MRTDSLLASHEARHYRELFHDCVIGAAAFLKKEKKFDTLKALAKHAAQVQPFCHWETLEIEALIGLKRSAEADLLYRETERVYREELSVLPGRHMIELRNQIELLRPAPTDLDSLQPWRNGIRGSTSALTGSLSEPDGLQTRCRIPAGRIMAACLFLFQLHQRNRDIAEKLFPLVGELRNAAIALGGCGDGGETDARLFPFGGIVCPVLLPDNAVEAVDSDKIELPARLADHRKPDGLFLSLAFLISSGKYRPLRITQTESRISSMYSMFTRIPFMRTRKRGS